MPTGRSPPSGVSAESGSVGGRDSSSRRKSGPLYASSNETDALGVRPSLSSASSALTSTAADCVVVDAGAVCGAAVHASSITLSTFVALASSNERVSVSGRLSRSVAMISDTRLSPNGPETVCGSAASRALSAGAVSRRSNAGRRLEGMFCSSDLNTCFDW